MPGNAAYGVGLAYRGFFRSALMKNRDSIDFLEIPTEDYIVRARRIMNDPVGAVLRETMDAFPCVAHGISLSIGSVEPLETDILKNTREFMDEYGFDEFSDHLTYHRMNDQDLTVFLSIPWDEVAARWVASQYKLAREVMKQPIGLELVAYGFPVTGCELSETEFVHKVAEYTDCWFLLDAANVFINAANHGGDPYEFIANLPGDRIQHLHIAGGHYADGQWMDSHSQPVQKEVFDLLDFAIEHTKARAVILERDAPPDEFGPILDDVLHAKEIFLKHRPAEPAPNLEALVKAAPEIKTVIDPLSLNDPSAELKDLQRYQRALVDCAFEMASGKHEGQTQDQIIDSFEISEEWKSRWRGMDWKAMITLKDKLAFIIEDDEEAARYYQMAEMGQWANLLGRDSFMGR